MDHLAPHLPPDVLARACGHLARCAAEPVSRVEDRLAVAADHLLWSLEAGYRRAAALRLELASATSLAERDQLTGLHNRHHLERYLGDRDRPADLLAMLVDVDDLKQVNDTCGHEGGAALLRCVADVLAANTRPGDVLIRWAATSS
ncbi:GGDEF domain-containing protein [Nocardioides sp.]|uniref:GGDEF domain-containing protein n=1 Tax=Nocardioides sp. TaxID=35761 RepID=UPI002631054A|nr:GGDEF domain-containing protein [Nocardioides sp.]